MHDDLAKSINDALYGKRRSKFNVDTSAKGKEKRTWIGPDGKVIVFHSVHEKTVWVDYVLPNEHIGVFSNVRRQVPFDLHVVTPGGFKVKIGRWIADFTAQDRSGTLIAMDAKGTKTALYERSRKHVEAEYGLRITEL